MLNLYEGKILRELVFGIKPDIFNPPKLVYYKDEFNSENIYTNEIVAGYYDDDQGKGYGITGEGNLVPNPCELVNWNFSYFCEYLKEHYPEAFSISNSEVFNKKGVLIANYLKKGPRESTNQKVYVDIPWEKIGLATIQISIPNWIDMKLEKEWDFCSLKSYLMDNYPDEFNSTEHAIFNRKGVMIAEESFDHTLKTDSCVALKYSAITSSNSIDSFVTFWKKAENVHPEEHEELDRKIDIDKIKVGNPNENEDETPETEPEEEMKPQNENLWTDKKQCTVEDLLIIESPCKLNAYWVQYETERFIRDQMVNWDGLEIDRLKRALASRESNLDKDWTTDTGYLRITGIAMTRDGV